MNPDANHSPQATFGEKMRGLRGKCSQIWVADEMQRLYPSLRISQSTVSAWEQKTLPPRGEVLTCIANFFDVPVTYFVDTEQRAVDAQEQSLLHYWRSGDFVAILRMVTSRMEESEA